MPTLQVITASTRPGRKGPAVARWFVERAQAHGAFQVDPVDLAEVGLPLFDEPRHPRLRQYEHEHTRRWSAIVARADAFVFVTPEYDHGPPSSLVNAMQYLVHEWVYKPLGLVSYGGVSAGTRAAQVIKLTAVGLKMMPLFETVSIPFFEKGIDEATGRFDPGPIQADAAKVMLDEMLRWTEALAALRPRD